MCIDPHVILTLFSCLDLAGRFNRAHRYVSSHGTILFWSFYSCSFTNFSCAAFVNVGATDTVNGSMNANGSTAMKMTWERGLALLKFPRFCVVLDRRILFVDDRNKLVLSCWYACICLIFSFNLSATGRSVQDVKDRSNLTQIKWKLLLFGVCINVTMEIVKYGELISL